MKKEVTTWLRNVLVVGVIFCHGAVAHGATLYDLMESSVENRSIVKSYEARLQGSRYDIGHARGRFLPSLDAGYEFNQLGENDLTLEEKDNNTLYVTASLNLFSGFKDVYSLASSKRTNEMRVFELKGIQQDIRLDVGQCFLNVYSAMARLSVTEDALSLYQKEYETVSLKYTLGILKKNDQLKIKVVMDDALQNVLRARATLDQAMNDLRLKTVTGVSVNELEFACFDTLPVISDMSYYQPLLLKNRSEIRAMTALYDISKFQAKSARSSFYPKLDLVSGYKFYDDCPNGSGDETRIQLNLSVNLFDGFQKNETLKKAEVDTKRISFDLKDLKLRLENDLENLLLDVDVALKKLDVAQNSQAEAQEHFRVTQLAFKKGILTSTDILDAIYYLSNARFNLLDSRVQVFKSHFHIERMIEDL